MAGDTRRVLIRHTDRLLLQSARSRFLLRLAWSDTRIFFGSSCLATRAMVNDEITLATNASHSPDNFCTMLRDLLVVQKISRAEIMAALLLLLLLLLAVDLEVKTSRVPLLQMHTSSNRSIHLWNSSSLHQQQCQS